MVKINGVAKSPIYKGDEENGYYGYWMTGNPVEPEREAQWEIYSRPP